MADMSCLKGWGSRLTMWVGIDLRIYLGATRMLEWDFDYRYV